MPKSPASCTIRRSSQLQTSSLQDIRPSIGVVGLEQLAHHGVVVDVIGLNVMFRPCFGARVEVDGVVKGLRRVGNLEANHVGKADLRLQKALEQETDAVGIIDTIDFGDEVQGFVFNRQHVH